MGLLSNKVVMEKEFLKEGSRRRRHRKKQMTFYYVVIVKSIYSNPIILFYTSSSLTFLERNVTHRCSFCGTWLPLFNVSYYYLLLYRIDNTQSFHLSYFGVLANSLELIILTTYLEKIAIFDEPNKKAYCFQGQILFFLMKDFIQGGMQKCIKCLPSVFVSWNHFKLLLIAFWMTW